MERTEAALAELKRTTTQIQARVDENSGKIDNNSHKIDENSRKIDENSRKIDENSRKIDDSAAETRRHFDVVVEALDVKISAIAEAVGATVGSPSDGNDRLANTVDALVATARSTSSDVQGLTQRTDHLEGRVTRVEARLDAVDDAAE